MLQHLLLLHLLLHLLLLLLQFYLLQLQNYLLLLQQQLLQLLRLERIYWVRSGTTGERAFDQDIFGVRCTSWGALG